MSQTADSATKFRAIQDAYEILSDAPTRAKYDSARNQGLLNKVMPIDSGITMGYLKQQQAYNLIKKGGATAIPPNRFRSAKWQNLPLSIKKVQFN